MVSPLVAYLFKKFNKDNQIKASSLYNSIDSTLIAEKNPKFINHKDWQKNRVTTRVSKKPSFDKKTNSWSKINITERICGSKALCILNKQKFIVHAEFFNINTSDANILKDCARYKPFLKGFVLADKGFSNKIVRERLKQDKNNIFKYQHVPCRFISPYHTKSKIQLNIKERKIYKKRWNIETLFQKLKDKFEDFNLDITGKYHQSIKSAKFFVSCFIYNYSKSTLNI